MTGDGETGAALVKHKDVDKIAFTGSTEVGRIIRKETAGTGKSLTLELGGKSPFIVFDDADIDGAIEGVVDAIWFNQGQVCCAGSRLLVQEGIAENFIARLKARMDKLRVGHPLDKAIDMGAIVDKVQLERIESLVKQGVAEGRDCYQSPGRCMPTSGCFYPPTLLTNVQPASTVAREEIFGPVLVAMTFRTPDEAVMLANNTRYGLAASVWSETIGLALDVAPKLAGRRRVGQCHQSVRCRRRLRRLSRIGLRPRRRTRRCLRISEAQGLGEAQAAAAGTAVARRRRTKSRAGLPMIDRTAKLFIGGKQARPDGNYSRPVLSPKGKLLGEVGEGNRKDIRNAVAAARGARGLVEGDGA